MVQDRWPSQDKVDPNTSVNGNLDTLHEAIVVNNVKSLLVGKNLTDLFVSVDKVPLLSNIRNLLVSISPPCLTWQLEGSTEIYGTEASTATGWQKGD